MFVFSILCTSANLCTFLWHIFVLAFYFYYYFYLFIFIIIFRDNHIFGISMEMETTKKVTQHNSLGFGHKHTFYIKSLNIILWCKYNEPNNFTAPNQRKTQKKKQKKHVSKPIIIDIIWCLIMLLTNGMVIPHGENSLSLSNNQS